MLTGNLSLVSLIDSSLNSSGLCRLLQLSSDLCSRSFHWLFLKVSVTLRWLPSYRFDSIVLHIQDEPKCQRHCGCYWCDLRFLLFWLQQKKKKKKTKTSCLLFAELSQTVWQYFCGSQKEELKLFLLSPIFFNELSKKNKTINIQCFFLFLEKLFYQLGFQKYLFQNAPFCLD